MARLWAIAALGFFALTLATGTTHGGDKGKDKDFRIEAKFKADDPVDPERGGASQTHVVAMKAGKRYTIDMVSTELDSFLRLLDPQGKQLDEDDDSGGNLNARILFNCPKDGEYKIVCTPFGKVAAGSYTLTVKVAGAVEIPTGAHARMIGQSAHEFEGDFAVNGKSIKLADLAGKVVLLDFCDVRSSQSIAMLPHLNQWHTAYKGKGLAIVSVTFYTSDLNQSLGFDDETGKVKTVAKADRKSDQALLTAFAAHYKVGHLLMTLAKEPALEVFDAYAVNSVPQLVLIDRKGVVRLVDITGDKNSSYVESQIKKVLTEK